MEPYNTGNYKKNREPPKNHTFVTKYYFENVYLGHKHNFHITSPKTIVASLAIIRDSKTYLSQPEAL